MNAPAQSDAGSPVKSRQFSLRALLLVTAIIGLIMATYRWDWVVTHRTTAESAEYELATTYRRVWGGRTQRHGPERLFVNGEVKQISWYEFDVLRVRESAGAQGRIEEIAHYDRDLRHGRYASGDGATWVYEGQFKHGQTDGPWKMLFDRRLSWRSQVGTCANIPQFTGGSPVPREPIEVLQAWKSGKRQGKWTWQTLQGEVLHVAEYDRDELITWNDQPVVTEFRDWIAKAAPADEMLQDAAQDATDGWTQNGGGTVRWLGRRKSYPRGSELLICCDGASGVDWQLRANQSFAAALCEFVCYEGYTLSYRYGVLWLTPATEAGSVFGDRTGVERVVFPLGSELAQQWEILAAVRNWQQPAPQLIRAALQGSGIELDLTSIEGEYENADPPQLQGNPLLILPRRDLLGYILFQLCLRCDQRGNTLFIHRR